MDTQKSEDPEHVEKLFADLHMRQLLTELTTCRLRLAQVQDTEFIKQFKTICDNLTSDVCFNLWKKPDFCPKGSYQYISPFLIVTSQGCRVSPILYVMLEKLEPDHLKEAITSPDLKILHLAISCSKWDAANLILMHMNARLESSIFECINIKDDDGKSVVDHVISNSRVPPSTLDAIIEAISNTDEFYKHLIVKGPRDGNTPLHNAMQDGYLNLATKLAAALKPEQLFALLEIQNKEGKTPLDIAEQKCPPSQAALFSTRQLMATILRSYVSNLNQSELNVVGDVQKVGNTLVQREEAGENDKISILTQVISKQHMVIQRLKSKQSEASALKEQVVNVTAALDDERQKREEMSSQHREEMSLLKGKVDILLANGTVKDLAMSQLNSQHTTLDNTCVDLRTDVDKLDHTCSDLRTDVEKLGRRSCRQENDVNEVACRVLDIQNRHVLLAETVLPATVTAVEVDDRDATDIAYGEFGDEMMDDD